MSRYTIAQLGWQWALRQDGRVITVHDTIQEAQAAKRALEKP